MNGRRRRLSLNIRAASAKTKTSVINERENVFMQFQIQTSKRAFFSPLYFLALKCSLPVSSQYKSRLLFLSLLVITLSSLLQENEMNDNNSSQKNRDIMETG